MRMLKHPNILTILATIYLLAYVVLLQLNILPNVTSIMFFTSPLLVVALAYSIIRYGKYDGKDLQENEHWGYHDRPDKRPL
jgi:hypothetical protein